MGMVRYVGMNEIESMSYFRYWGKAEKDGTGYHLLPYHCLDVAAVAAAWWEEDKVLRDLFVRACQIEEQILKAYLLFLLPCTISVNLMCAFNLKQKSLYSV